MIEILKKEKENLLIGVAGHIDVYLATELELSLAQIQKEHKKKNLVLNLSKVKYMSSSALGALVTVHRSLEQEERKLILCCLPPSVTKLLQITELMNLFPIFEGEEEAMR